jgi:hypothetical protein
MSEPAWSRNRAAAGTARSDAFFLSAQVSSPRREGASSSGPALISVAGCVAAPTQLLQSAALAKHRLFQLPHVSLAAQPLSLLVDQLRAQLVDARKRRREPACRRARGGPVARPS